MANRVGVDMLGSLNSSSRSRLYPVSRDLTAQLTIQLRHGEMPEEYPPASPNQSCGTPAHPGHSIVKANMVRTIDRYVRETTSDYNTALRDLSSRTQDTRLFRFHAHLGDYAMHVCNLLKEQGKRSPPPMLSGPWTKIVEALDAHQDRVTSWTARGCPGPEPSCLEMDAIELRVKQVVDAGITDLDTGLALFAIRSYARRNLISHGGLFDLSKSGNSVGLAEYIDNDDKLLEEILPDDEKRMVGNWRRLLMIRRNAHMRQAGDGDGNAKDPLRVAPGSSPQPTGRLGRAVLRSQIEMGLMRGSKSPDGPPPTNVEFDPSSFRHRS